MTLRTTIFILLLVAGVATFVLWRENMPSAPALGKPSPITTVTYSCNASKTVTVAYYEGKAKPALSPSQPPIPGGSVELSFSDGRSMTLAQTLSADGARYANDDESFIFWDKGNSALVLEDNKEKSYVGCIATMPEPVGKNLPVVYSNSTIGFSLRLPSLAGSISKNHLEGYIADEKYRYQELGLGKDISGVKFTIPSTMATGTNLSSDTYLSVEEISDTPVCSAVLFLEQGVTAYMTSEGEREYSVASSTGAAAGNRYEETVYAFPNTSPCLAVRYFVHSGAFENYPAGMVREFDRAALLAEFNMIRRTLIAAP